MIDPTASLIVAALSVLSGSVVQGSVGLGVGMIAAPFLTWALPESMPAVLVMLGGAMTIATLVNRWRHIDPATWGGRSSDASRDSHWVPGWS